MSPFPTRSNTMYREPKRRSSRSRLLPGLLVLLVAGFLVLGLLLGSPPEIRIDTSLPAIGASTDVEAVISEPGRGVSSSSLWLEQAEERILLAEADASPRPAGAFWRHGQPEMRLQAQVGKGHQEALREGTARLVVESERAGTFLRAPRPVRQEIELEVDLTPPGIRQRTETVVVRQGGAGAVAYEVDDDAVHHGVRVGDLEFTGHARPDGRQAVLFGVPFDLAEGGEIRLFAVDALGNRAEKSFLARFDRHTYPKDDIRLSDGFFEAVVPEILTNTPELEDLGKPLDNYLQANRDLRGTNAQQLVELNRGSAGEKLWEGAFDQLPSSRVMAVFGDQRSYLYEGKVVDHQTHLGYDLASRVHAPVPAANRGVVVLARYFGIYGNTVVLDHGYGLATLYSHLSEIQVETGQEVERGDTLGLTGETGLAGGDHLHFTVMVGDVMVDPIEWWDRRWVANRIDPVFE